MVKQHRVLAAGVLVAVFTAATNADQVLLLAGLDGTLYEANPATVANGVGSHFFVGRTAVGDRHRGLIAFNFASIPPGSTINSVSLALSLDRSRGSNLAISMYRVAAAWGEGTSNAGNANDGDGAPATAGDITWTHRVFNTTPWTTPGGDYVGVASATASVSGVNFYTWSGSGLVADVQGWLATPATNFGWLMKGPETQEGNSKRFMSGDSTNTFQVPVLTVNFTPPVVPCPADLDNGSGTGTPNGTVDINDLLYFLAQFEAGSANVDLDNGSVTGTPDGGVDINDLLYFLVRFENGC